MKPPINMPDMHDERVAIYRSLKGRELGREGIFIAEGEKVVKELKGTGILIISFLTTPEFYKKFRSTLAKLSRDDIPVYVMSRDRIQEIIGFRFHQGLMAACRIPRRLSIEKALKEIGSPHTIVALNGVNNPENVGLIARNAAAFGAGAIIVDGKTYDPYYRKAVRVSMGTIFRMPVIYAEGLDEALRWLKNKLGTRIIAASLDKKSKDLSVLDLSGNICFVFGNEDTGIDAKTLRSCDVVARIPIEKGVDSLNVACSSAIMLCESYKRRGGPICPPCKRQ
jgi:tRNA G18 (ribose-2'-O)-methylase SpoU